MASVILADRALLLGLPVFLIVLICIALFVVHFLPAFVAWRRDARNFLWIFLINLFFGWTLIGWVLALVWALNDGPKYGRGYVGR